MMTLHHTLNHRCLILCAFAVLAVPSWCIAAGSPMRPGQWEVTARMEMPGMPAQAQQTHSASHCITPEMAENPRAAMDKLSTGGQSDTKCAMTSFDTSGNVSTWRVECTGARSAHMDGEVTYDSDSAYHGTTRMSLQGPQGPMIVTQVMKGRRVGDCKQ